MKNMIDLLRDVLQSITLIKQYTLGGKSAFGQESLIQSGVFYQIVIIGEAVRVLPLEFRQQHPEIPWFAIIGMRNILVHEYFAVDLEIVRSRW